MHMKFFAPAISAFLALSIPVTARLLDGSLKPAGGEAFKPGDVVTIEWTASQADNGLYDIYLSRDGGKTWPLEFAEGWQGSKVDNAKNAYRWTIPSGPNTIQARLRVCQISGGHCVQPGVFTLLSGDFTISTTTGVRDGASEFSTGPGLSFLPEAGSVEVEIGLEADMEVSLRAYDAAGKVVADLLDRRMQAGQHRLSIFSHRLESSGPLIFRLMRGSRTTTWNGSAIQ
jgi:hypothetical protein